MKKLGLYLYDRLAGAKNVVFPHSVELTNDLQQCLDNIYNNTDLGPRPITLRSLTSNICDYLMVLYKILQHYENNNAVNSYEIATEVTYFWVNRMLETFDLSSLSKTQKRKLTHQTRQAMNNKSSKTTHISISIPNDLLLKVTELIEQTRSQIKNSLEYKAGATISVDQCFTPSRASLQADHRLFLILPMRHLGMPFVDISFLTLLSLRNHSVDFKDDKIVAPKTKGIHRIRDECRIFHEIFDFRKVGLQSR